MMRQLAPLLWCLLATAAHAQVSGVPSCSDGQAFPPRLQMSFDAQASRGPLTLDGENELTFAIDGDRFTLRSVTRSVLYAAEQQSRGEVRGTLLQPVEYIERAGRREPKITRIDWATQRVTFTANEGEPQAAEPKLQDRLSLLLQVGQQLRQQQGRGDVALPVAGVRSVSSYRFVWRGPEALDLPLGRVETLKLERPLTSEQDSVEVWLAPQWCWLPVKIRFTDDRRQVVQNRLRSLRFD